MENNIREHLSDVNISLTSHNPNLVTFSTPSILIL